MQTASIALDVCDCQKSLARSRSSATRRSGGVGASMPCCCNIDSSLRGAYMLITDNLDVAGFNFNIDQLLVVVDNRMVLLSEAEDVVVFYT